MTALGAHWPGSRPVPELVAELRNRRIKAGLSQRKLAKKAGVAECTIAHMERGKETPRCANLNFIAMALGMELQVVPLCAMRRALEYADWLRAQGWNVSPPQPQDARAAGGVVTPGVKNA